MAKDPAFLWYDGDAARDMAHMNRLERGAYVDIVQAQKKFGKLTIDQIKKVLSKDFELCWSAIELVLVSEDGYYFIEWVRDSICKREKHSEHQKENVGKRWYKNGNTKPIPNNDVVLPLENANANENEIEDVKELENAKEREVNDVNALKIRFDLFKDEVLSHKEYVIDMLENFINYWTEQNKSKTKMRFELEKTWDTSGRLRTWASREKNINRSSFGGRQEVSKEELIAQMQRVKLS